MRKFLRFLFKKQKNTIKKSILLGKCAGKKIATVNGATLTIDNGAEKKKTMNEEKIENIVEKCLKNPEKFFEYIKGAKTPVYKIKNADKILSLINEQEGFILPQNGFKALYLNLILNKKLSTKTTEMFVLRNYNVNSYAIAYQFYNWYGYKMKLEGFEESTQKKFKNVFEICETNKIDDLSFEEILELKSAIKRDIEAIDFVKKLAVKNQMAKKNLDKIKEKKLVKI